MAKSRPTTNNNINIHVPTYKKRSSALLCWSACHFVWFNLLHALPIALPHCPAQSQPHHECQHRRTGRCCSTTSARIDGQCGWRKRRRHLRGRHYFRLAKVFTAMAIHHRCVHHHNLLAFLVSPRCACPPSANWWPPCSSRCVRGRCSQRQPIFERLPPVCLACPVDCSPMSRTSVATTCWLPVY